MSFMHYRGKEPPRFAHPSELELARLLDASGIPWEYEPHTFALSHDARGRIVEGFTPDFFLPEAGMYVECTTTQPSLMSRKRRKIRRASELHGLLVTLHGREDFERLLQKYSKRARTKPLGLPGAGLLCRAALHTVRAVLHRRMRGAAAR